jgi:hypothetical protein
MNLPSQRKESKELVQKSEGAIRTEKKRVKCNESRRRIEFHRKGSGERWGWEMWERKMY